MMTKIRPTVSRHRPRVLVIEDELDLQELLRYNLGRAGFDVTCASTGEMALELASTDVPDVILLDLMLPGVDGLTVCRTLRVQESTKYTPIVMVTAKGEEADMVVGLELGADDYVTKPFSPRVLIARINAVLRRRAHQQMAETSHTSIIQSGGLSIDRERYKVTFNGEEIVLTATEFKLLCMMASKPGRVFTRQQIIASLHGENVVVTDRSIDVQIVGLRKKLGAASGTIETVRGIGYRFSEKG